MKKKKVVIILISMIILIGGVFLISNIYHNNKFNKTKRKRQNNLAIMIKEAGASDYVKYTSKDIPKGNYILNREKSYCKNNGVIGDYDSTLGKISFSFIGTDSCYLYFDYEVPDGWEIVLINNSDGATTVEEAKAYIEGKDTPDFSQIADTNEGIFAIKDDFGKSYYFRGAVDNNWVKFGKYTEDIYYTYDSNSNSSLVKSCNDTDLCYKIASKGDDMFWRIIRINGDGSIRMIYSGTYAPDVNTKVSIVETDLNSSGYSTLPKTNIGYSVFNANYNGSEYAGYMYAVGEQYGTETDSTIKTYLDDWYVNYTNLSNESVKIVDQIFCNDRSASTVSTGATGEISSWTSTGTNYYYGARNRIWGNNSNPTPSLICNNNNDRFSTTGANGNGKLSYPVGLITADEINIAGASSKFSNNESYYLHTGDYYWTGSPLWYTSSANSGGYSVDRVGRLGGDSINRLIGVRPVISLSPKVKLSGNGTYNSVYTVS